MSQHLNLVDSSDADLSPSQFLQAHPQLCAIDILISDLNGVWRGKRIQPEQLSKVAKDGVCFPASLFGLDITGETSENTGLGFTSGDADRRCRLIPHSLSRIPWQQKPMAQVMVTMQENSGQPFAAEPRNVLTRQVERLREYGFTACIAVELEFYLIDPKHDSKGMAQTPMAPDGEQRLTATQCYSIEDLDQHAAFLQDVQTACREQHIDASNAVAEYAPGQFEVNLHHLPDPIAACDQAMLLKRVIKAIAQQHGYKATFMAKPHQTQCGSGMHVHISLLDQQGHNAFSHDHALLQQALAGMLTLMPASQLLFAPHANSYRRLQPDMFVPMSASWGHDNRTVALRIPNDSKANTRIEHRVAGADANPYLVCAAILAGLLYGLEHKLTPPPPITGDANAVTLPSLPYRWADALALFADNEPLQHAFGASFMHIYASVKHSELAQFEQQITPLEMQWYQDAI